MIIKPSLLEVWILSKERKIEFYSRQPMRSWVRQYADFEYGRFSTGTSLANDTGGVSRSRPLQCLYVTAIATNALYGIVVGSGTNAPAMTDYKLQTQILHGSAAGLLYHQACSINPVTVAGANAYFPIQRNFNNNSGADITVQEVGLYVMDNTYYFCLARDLTGGHVVPNTKTYVAQYTWSVSV